MDTSLYVKCPNANCGKVLAFKSFPNYQEAKITCPYCNYQAKIKDFIPFTPKGQTTPQQAPAQQPMGPVGGYYGGDQTQLMGGGPAGNDQTQMYVQTPKMMCLETHETKTLQMGKNTIGRTASQQQATITFNDPEKYLSRNHATVNVVNTPSGLQIQLSDNKSVNGTFIQGKRLPAGTIVKVTPDMVITLGRLRFQITFPPAGPGNKSFDSTMLV